MPIPTLGEFETAVLLTVARLGDDAYGLQILRDLSALRQRDYSVGAIYTTLRRLEEKGAVESWTTEPLAVRGGRSRRQFRVTASGKQALADARQRAAQQWAMHDMGMEPS